MAKQKKPKTPQINILEPKWKTVEKVVALLEQSLSPEARVTHNVRLPNLSTGHLEQCDVLVEMGQEPRMMRTIVEVQKRTESVKPNDFRGWCQKMREVGANRLICVSAKPFSQSIKDSVAKDYGLTVLLVRLEALESNNWPFQIVDNALNVFIPTVEVDTEIRPNPLLVFDPNNNPFKEYEGELFASQDFPNCIKRGDQEELLPMTDLINEGVKLLNDDPKASALQAGTHKVKFRWNPKNTHLDFNSRNAIVQSVYIAYIIKIDSTLFPCEIYSYTQEGQNTSTWIARARGKIKDEETEISFTCAQNKDGGFSITSLHVSGSKQGLVLLWRIPSHS